MIFNLDSQPLDTKFGGWTFGNCPTLQDAIKFQTKIPMKPSGMVFLN
jgi:hypothetical protein